MLGCISWKFACATMIVNRCNGLMNGILHAMPACRHPDLSMSYAIYQRGIIFNSLHKKLTQLSTTFSSCPDQSNAIAGLTNPCKCLLALTKRKLREDDENLANILDSRAWC